MEEQRTVPAPALEDHQTRSLRRPSRPMLWEPINNGHPAVPALHHSGWDEQKSEKCARGVGPDPCKWVDTTNDQKEGTEGVELKSKLEQNSKNKTNEQYGRSKQR